MDKAGMARRVHFSPPAVGGVSLLVVFAVLCLTVFALLSLTTVRADVRLADASAQAVSDYYAADCQAQEILARLRAGETPDGVTWSSPMEGGETEYSYTVSISNTQELQVEVLVWPDGRWSVQRWQAAAAGGWEIDEGLEVWDGTPF
ncbi:hypothetical protein [uncultured Oscillibacter sp.]|uniref:hypothetical protein n=1 Tax=uncultured Oscillibacter sp. TaxID=876091 RepID=UPI002615D1ED|nr:hypothetical protein [uncultured Oscillibacter sp.]